jgi:hypothetical protein
MNHSINKYSDELRKLLANRGKRELSPDSANESVRGLGY